MNTVRSMYHLLYRKKRWQYFNKYYQLPIIDKSNWIGRTKEFIPPILDELYLPPYRGDERYDDATPLFGYVEKFKPNIVVELGTAYGTTAANICVLSDAKIYTVNATPEQISGTIKTVDLSREEIGRVYREHGFSDRVVQIYQNTRDLNLQSYMGNEKADLIIIDACHDPDYVVSDFLRVLPVSYENTVVLFHDVSPTMVGHLRASYVACMYLRKMGYNICYLDNSTWGVWKAASSKFEVPMHILIWEYIDRAMLRLSGMDIFDDVKGLYWLAKEEISV